MKIGEILYFSPRYKFIDIDWNDKERLLEAFQDRILGFFLDPAKNLNEKKFAFASGILCVTTIDCLARIETGLNATGKRIKNWLESNIKEFNQPDPDNPSQSIAYRFYKEFRNGLVHEGHITNAGQFSYDSDKLIHFYSKKSGKKVMIINPELLLNEIQNSFDKYFEKLQKDESAFESFKKNIINIFKDDIKIALKE